ncbi:MAG: ATP-binding protein [Nitrospira sp.]|nr:ATP-binding protein [Nitrospira sp.]
MLIPSSTPHEQHLMLCYLTNAASRLHCHSKEAEKLSEWVADNADELNLEGMVQPPRRRSFRDESKAGPSKQEWQAFRKILEGKRSTTKNAPEDVTARRIRNLGKTTGLSPTDMDILNFMLRCETQPMIESMVDDVFDARSRRKMAKLNVKGIFLRYLLDRSVHTIHSRFKPDAPLLRSGLLSIDSDGEVNLMDRLHRLAVTAGEADLDPTSLLLGTTTPSELDWSDFDHLAQDRDHVEGLLNGALQTGTAGVNVLLYGPPGTGKTEFCKVLAGRLGATLYSIGEADEDKKEPNRNERLNELKLAQCLVGRDRKSILLFDEMDDLLSGTRAGGMGFFLGFSNGHRHGESKVFMNRLLEENAAPTLWTTNLTDEIDPSILRRMMFAMELRMPPPKVRARIWARQLSRHGIEAGANDALALATEFDATPGVAAGATAAAKLGNGGLDTVRHGVRNLSRVLSCEKPSQRPPEQFDPTFIRADQDLVRLADRLVKKAERRFSLCLQGPPGTGKSAFVRYLAERLGLEIMQKRASDLLSMWVGGTEKNITRAFAEARSQEAFLVFDEADSLLADRRMAQRGWEISQVNEMLTWMESHRLPFACTTNFVEKLDPATLRRFTFKVKLGYLSTEQAGAMFRAYFNRTPSKELAALSVLTPGDFAVVRRAVEALDLLHDARFITDMLRTECEAKPDQARKSGFLP